ncbi:RNA-binding protein 48-like [Mytilus edulis]|uniref:RNA-binding protein 48-like n=1 Tax=Mytilus edulis TaxID=6550 RepID=UPI0039F0C13F
MSAPMDGKSTNIPAVPSHHIRLNLCATRPLYREGRNPKAVKVYTVNQESQYLMIQDVPALGTTQELIKLCAVHGAVEEYRLLDEFPTVDRYTDVVLVKFRRILSARHAKKKLDNWSFFGGVLHVTYAPEYESVEETRVKLQDRRKGIAARLRILGKDQSRRGKTSEGHIENDSKQAHKVSESIESRIPALPSYQNNHSFSKNHVSTDNSQDNINNKMLHITNFSSNHGNNTDYSTHQNSEPYSYGNNLVSAEKNDNLHQTHSQQTSVNPPPPVIEPPPWCQQTLVIPPPPVREAFPNYSKINQHKTTFDFARVPTANAPFPSDYDGRKFPQNVAAKEIKTQIHVDHPKDDVIKQNSAGSNKQSASAHGNLSHPKYNKILDKTGAKQEKIIIKDFKKCGATPKFIPRQTLNLLKAKSEHGETKASNKDNLEIELRKNAIVLGSTQGPALVPEEFKKKEKSCTEKAVEDTVEEIRKRVSMFSSEKEDSTSRKRPKPP